MNTKLKVHQLSSIGDRKTNQDCMAHKINDDYALFVVADGLGGHYAGEKASHFFCLGMFRQAAKYQHLLEYPSQDKKQVLIDWAAAAIDDMEKSFLANENTLEKAKNSHTTAVILYIDDEQVITAHCGDSRIYRLNDRKVIWRTRDHSLIQKQLDEGQITEYEMRLHPEQNQLTRTISIRKRHLVEVNIYPPIKKDETFFLCTDGFWEFAKEKEFLQLANSYCDLNEIKKIVKMVNLRASGKGDNLTVQWIRAC